MNFQPFHGKINKIHYVINNNNKNINETEYK